MPDEPQKPVTKLITDGEARKNIIEYRFKLKDETFQEFARALDYSNRLELASVPNSVQNECDEKILAYLDDLIQEARFSENQNEELGYMRLRKLVEDGEDYRYGRYPD